MAKYFTLKELVASNIAAARKIDNTPGFTEVAHLQELVDTLLDPLRDAWGSGIIVTSGYRCPLVNSIAGGSPTSPHPTGYAADLYPANGKFDQFAAFVKDWIKKSGKRWDQLIEESNSRGDHWIHIGLKNRAGQQRCQILKLKQG